MQAGLDGGVVVVINSVHEGSGLKALHGFFIITMIGCNLIGVCNLTAECN